MQRQSSFQVLRQPWPRLCGYPRWSCQATREPSSRSFDASPREHPFASKRCQTDVKHHKAYVDYPWLQDPLDPKDRNVDTGKLVAADHQSATVTFRTTIIPAVFPPPLFLVWGDGWAVVGRTCGQPDRTHINRLAITFKLFGNVQVDDLPLPQLVLTQVEDVFVDLCRGWGVVGVPTQDGHLWGGVNGILPPEKQKTKVINSGERTRYSVRHFGYEFHASSMTYWAFFGSSI